MSRSAHGTRHTAHGTRHTAQSLVADDNKLANIDSFPAIPTLRTLSLNKNLIASLAMFLRDAPVKFAGLGYLSLLGNPCCPSEIFGSEKEEYRR